MPEITCVGCGNGHVIVYQGYAWGGGRSNDGILQGVLICHHPLDDRYNRDKRCNAATVFEITGSSVSFLPGKLFEEDLVGVSDDVRGLFDETIKCFYGKAYKGTLGLCRSTVERALEEKNVKGKDLFAKINNCPASILGAQEKTWAESARLNGREALHRLMNVTASQALSGLNITITLANHIAAQPPLPAAQSETGSNAP